VNPVVWQPSEHDLRSSRIAEFARRVEQHHGITLPDYAALHRWSVEHLDDFWSAVWNFFDVGSHRPAAPVLSSTAMPGATWFPHEELNYVAHAFQQGRDDQTAIIDASEPGSMPPKSDLSWRELARQVASLAHTLSSNGIGRGDRVVGYLPNIPETVIAFLATASLGAVWAGCGQDYAVAAAHARFEQLEPAALITADGYYFNGKCRDNTANAANLRELLPSVRLAIAVSRIGTGVAGMLDWVEAVTGNDELVPLPVPFDHPLWVVFSSGTTGRPKGIVHGHGGVLLEHLKFGALQLNLGADDTFFWFTTPSWMVWNTLVGGLLVGATIVCYDGSPSFPQPTSLWDVAARYNVTALGTSPGYLLSCLKDGTPVTDHRDLKSLQSVSVTGAALPATTTTWLAGELDPRVRIGSVSGGTDVVTGFVGSAPTVPVWAGEISARCLGVAVDAYDQSGHPVRGEVGEMVITRPMPSMPIRFWNDPDGSRYRDAYFSTFPGVWRQGDWITITERESVIVHGRSDSTLNRHGVRMGSADIYDAVDEIPEVVDSLVLGIEQQDGGYWMPLFVVLADGTNLDEALRHRIAESIRRKASPRHVPDDIIAAPGIPHTRTGKKLEVPLKRLLQGASVDSVVDPASVDDPTLIDWYATHVPRAIPT
jgi:acetoacetyl-CoA synthetase